MTDKLPLQKIRSDSFLMLSGYKIEFDNGSKESENQDTMETMWQGVLSETGCSYTGRGRRDKHTVETSQFSFCLKNR